MFLFLFSFANFKLASKLEEQSSQHPQPFIWIQQRSAVAPATHPSQRSATRLPSGCQEPAMTRSTGLALKSSRPGSA